jgi:hypothetical protein
MLPDASIPFAPFDEPVALPTVTPFDAPLVCLQINERWVVYLMGAAMALCAASTWRSDDENAVRTVTDNARKLIEYMMDFDTCAMPIQFRNNPAQAINFQFSLDGGSTWSDGPDQAGHITPTFTADGLAPSGYDLSVNAGDTSTAIPLVTANDPDAVVTDPASLTRNLITATDSADGLLIQALATVGVKLVQANGVAAAFQKVFPGLELATSVLEVLAGSDYSYPLLEIVSSI